MLRNRELVSFQKPCNSCGYLCGQSLVKVCRQALVAEFLQSQLFPNFCDDMYAVDGYTDRSIPHLLIMYHIDHCPLDQVIPCAMSVDGVQKAYKDTVK